MSLMLYQVQNQVVSSFYGTTAYDFASHVRICHRAGSRGKQILLLHADALFNPHNVSLKTAPTSTLFAMLFFGQTRIGQAWDLVSHL